MWGSKKQDQTSPDDNMSWVTGQVLTADDSSVHANVTFPTPWTCRIQTPIPRLAISSQDMWGQPRNYTPETFGGPFGG